MLLLFFFFARTASDTDQAAPTRHGIINTRGRIAAAALRAKSSTGLLPCFHVPEAQPCPAKALKQCRHRSADHTWNHSLGLGDISTSSVGASTHQPICCPERRFRRDRFDLLIHLQETPPGLLRSSSAGARVQITRDGA